MKLETQIQATREGGSVQRYHTVPHTRQQDNAQHTYGCLNLLLLLHPAPSLDLVRAVQWHDLPERWTGDLPSTVKKSHPRVGEAVRACEAEVFNRLGLMVDLGDDDLLWLDAVDQLEAYLWCRENSQDPHVDKICTGQAGRIQRMHTEGTLPEPVWRYFVQVSLFPYTPLPNKLDQVR